MHKFYSIEDWKKFAAENPETVKYVAASSGTGDGDWDRLQVLTLDYKKTLLPPCNRIKSNPYYNYTRSSMKLTILLYIRWLPC